MYAYKLYECVLCVCLLLYFNSTCDLLSSLYTHNNIDTNAGADLGSDIILMLFHHCILLQPRATSKLCCPSSHAEMLISFNFVLLLFPIAFIGGYPSSYIQYALYLLTLLFLELRTILFSLTCCKHQLSSY